VNIVGHCEMEVAWQLRLLHAVLLVRLRKNAPVKIRRQVSAVIRKLTQTEVHMNFRLQTTIGNAWLGMNRIDLHYRALRSNPVELEKTYAHELGHLIANWLFREQGHGVKWKLVMLWLEANDERCHTVDVSPYRRPIDAERHAA
jgi:predicted SprT family Zn-dependent metalloprotease